MLGWKERLLIGILSLAILGGVAYWLGALYLSMTESVPDRGGRYVEGVVGQPRYVNPVLSQTSAADRDLVSLMFCGLFSYDGDGNLRNRLAESIERSEDGLTYTVRMRRGVLWHDGHELTAHDVVFTVAVMSDPSYRSPLRESWKTVSVSQPDDHTVVFSLKKPFSAFPENLTFGVLPKHVWESIPSDRFTLADYNLESPIGCGPYRFYALKKDSNGSVLSYDLRAFPEYFEGEPYISKLTLQFYEGEDQLVAAYQRKEVQGVSPLSPRRSVELRDRPGLEPHPFSIPRVFGVFFNPVKSVPLGYVEVREAISLATDRDVIIRDVVGSGTVVSSPILPFMIGTPEPKVIGFDPDAAAKILDEKGWTSGEGGVRFKGDVRLEFDLAVPDWPELREVADTLAAQWERIGARVNVKTYSFADFQGTVLRPRGYDAILFGEEMTLRPDYYTYWHSSEKSEFGLNLAMFDDEAADSALATLLGENDPDKRREAYTALQDAISAKYPAVFLYSPSMTYFVTDRVRGISLHRLNTNAERFDGIRGWHIETKRKWKE